MSRLARGLPRLGERDAARDPPLQDPWCSSATEQVHRDDAEKQAGEFYEVRLMRWKGGWGARAAMPSLYTSLTPPARDPTNSWQAAPLRRGEGRLEHTMKLLRLATRRRAVLGASFLDQDDSKGHLNPQAGLSGHVRARA